MLKIDKAQGVITSFSAKDAPSNAPAKNGTEPALLHNVKCVIELDVTDNMKMAETLFPGSDTAIKLTAADSENKGWSQTAKTKPGAHSLTVRGSDGQEFDLDCVDVKAGVQLKVSAQNSKKTNQATMILRCVGRFTQDQIVALHGLLRADVKVWVKPSQQDFFDSSGEAAKKEESAKKKEQEKTAKAAEKAAAKAEKDKKKEDNVDIRPTALRGIAGGAA